MEIIILAAISIITITIGVLADRARKRWMKKESEYLIKIKELTRELSGGKP